MMPSTVKAITGRRSSQRNRSAACGGAAGASPPIDFIIGSSTKSAGEAIIDSIAVREAQGRSDLEAQPRQHDLRLQKVALHVGSGVPPEVILGRGVANDPDRDRTGDGVIRPALDQLTAVEVRRLEIDG